MIKNLKPLQFILSISLSIALTIIISIFITTAQTSSNSHLADDLQVKSSAKFNVGGSSQVIIDTSGNVGIGTTPSSSYKLDVSGDVRMSSLTSCGKIYTNANGKLTCGTDAGVTSESDPTVASSVKDGVSWSEISSIPAGFSDNVDNNTTYTAGTGISISGTTITNSGDTSTSDDITSLTAGTGISISGTGNTRTITNSKTYFSGVSIGLSKSSCGGYDCYNDSNTANAFCRESGYVYGSVTSSETNSYAYRKYTWTVGWESTVNYDNANSKIRGLTCYR